MITVRELIDSELSQRPELFYLLQENLINVNGLARHLKPVIEKELGEAIGTETISMAIRRLQKKRSSKSNKILHPPKARNIHIQLDVSILTYQAQVPAKVIALSTSYRFFSLANGRSESMLAISREDADALEDGAERSELNMAALTITLEGESFETVGAYAYIQTVLAVAGIPIAEVVSVHDDLTLLVSDQHIDRAFQILRDALKG